MVLNCSKFSLRHWTNLSKARILQLVQTFTTLFFLAQCFKFVQACRIFLEHWRSAKTTGHSQLAFSLCIKHHFIALLIFVLYHILCFLCELFDLVLLFTVVAIDVCILIFKAWHPEASQAVSILIPWVFPSCIFQASSLSFRDANQLRCKSSWVHPLPVVWGAHAEGEEAAWVFLSQSPVPVPVCCPFSELWWLSSSGIQAKVKECLLLMACMSLVYDLTSTYSAGRNPYVLFHCLIALDSRRT